jgi:integrase
MNIVDACTREELAQVTLVLQKRYSPIYADVWRFGLQVSLRISDLLSIKYSDLDISGRSLTLIEAKTGKRKTIRLNSVALDVIASRRELNPSDTYLFEYNTNRSKGLPVSRESVSRVFKEAGDWLGLKINTHSMRKSRGACMYAEGVPLELIAKTLNHSNTRETLRYIGITAEQVQNTYDEFIL